MPHRLSLAVRRHVDGSDDHHAGLRELVFQIDGAPAFGAWTGIGMDPDDVLTPDHPLIPPADGTPVTCLVQRCGCGEVGCASLTATIRRDGEGIEFSVAETRPGRRAPLTIGPFVFGAAQYETEVRRAHDERGWETRHERVARLISESLRDLRDARPWSFDWASAGWPGDAVVVSVTEHRPNPNAGQPAGPRLDGGNGAWWAQAIEPDELQTQHLGSFEVTDLADDVIIDRVVRAVRSHDVSGWTVDG